MNNKNLYKKFCDFWVPITDPRMFQPSLWDNLADEWNKSMKSSTQFENNMSERVSDTAAFLRTRGLLSPGTSVIDIGCGPGLTTVEFAKTAEKAVGIDISPKMIESAKQNAASQTNAEFIVGNFHDMSVESLHGPYDLVFASITPAVTGVDSIKKMIQLSKGFCFYSGFVHWFDTLEKEISENVFDTPYSPSHGGHGKNFYSLFNMMWLEGYYPEVSFYTNRSTSSDTPEVAAERYSRIFSKDRTSQDDIREKIFQYLKTLFEKKDQSDFYSEYKFGRMLWNVNDVDSRREYGSDDK